MAKKILVSLATVAIVISGVIAISAGESHIINVTAHIENSLAVSPHGIDFGTVFPQEYIEKDFIIRLSDSFMDEDQTRVKDVQYKIVQKPKPWRDDFDGTIPPHRSLIFVDPDDNGTKSISGGVLTLTTGKDVEDLYGPGEPATGTDWTAPRMVMHMGGNFTVETLVTASPNGFVGPDGRYQSGGILVYGSDGNVVRLELTRWGAGTGDNAVYMESQENGVKVGKRYTMNEVGNTVYLKVERKGNEFTGFYRESTDDPWQEAPIQEGKVDFTNENIGDYPQVGVAVTDNQDESSFSADFEYVEMNGGYLNLCPFLSKIGEAEYGTINVPSYYNRTNNECAEPSNHIAEGELRKCYPEEQGCTEDAKDCWTIDLKVPPVDGYVAQDWPDSCRQWVVPVDGADYGCDLWIEVVDYSYFSQ